MNMLEASLVHDNGELSVQVGSHKLRLPQDVLSLRPALPAYVGRKLALGIRPEDMEDAGFAAGADEDSTFKVPVSHHEDMGSELIVYFELDAPPVVTEDTRDLAADQGTEAVRSLERQARQQRATVIARVSARSKARAGEPVALYADMRNAHFFDLATGEAIYDGQATEGDRVSATEVV